MNIDRIYSREVVAVPESTSLQDAALWRNYEREYTKVKNESDEAFMEVFAKQFRKSYEKQLREGFSKDD